MASFVVSSLSDAGAGSLRDAVESANLTTEADEISFQSDLIGTIHLASTITIKSPLAIQGGEAGRLTLQAAATPSNEFRVFDVSDTAGNVTFAGLTMTGGRVTQTADPIGGAIRFRSDGVLTMMDSEVTGNQAVSGGAIFSEFGGAIQIQSSTISGNTAVDGAGGAIHNLDGDTTVTYSVLSENRSFYSGGAIFSPYGNVAITQSQVTDNQITYEGYNGAGIYSGSGDVTISGSTISGNTAVGGEGGGLYNISGSVSITDSSLDNNRVGYSGGGIFNYSGALSIAGTTIGGNTSLYGNGAAVFNDIGVLTLTRSSITGNSAFTDGGGISNNSGRVLIRDSLLADNEAGDDGGGIATLTGSVTLTNSTVSGNTAGVQGGGIQSDSAPLRLVNSTVVLNRGGDRGGGIAVDPNGDGEAILLHNSIIALNTSPIGPDFVAPAAADQLDVRFTLVGHNDATTLNPAAPGAGNFVGSAAGPIDPKLGPLSGNGGPTKTHNLLIDSPARDSASDSLAIDFGADGALGGGDDTPLTSDQRGGLYLRKADGSAGIGTTDMGAVERQLTPTLTVDTAADVVNGNLLPGDRSLRELIAIANETAGPDTIDFAAGVFSITLDPALGQLVISDELSLHGRPNDLVTILKEEDDAFRLLHVTSEAGDVRIANLVLVGGNTLGDGGAIESRSSGVLTIVNSTLRGNQASTGGAIAASAGTIAVAGSTLSGNTASGDGGAIAATGDAATLSIVNSTLSGNQATLRGGGLFAENASVLISSSTLTLNSAEIGGGVGLLNDGNGESLRVENSIVAGNSATTAADLVGTFDPGDLAVEVSLIGDNDGSTLNPSMLVDGRPEPDAAGNLVGGGASPVIDPMLGPLNFNGGPVLTHLPLEESLVIDSGSMTRLPADSFDVDDDGDTFETLPVDQRGAIRVVDGVDIGSVELAAVPDITWSDPGDIVFGTLLDQTQLNASSSTEGTFQYSPPTGTQLDAGLGQPLTVLFTPADPLAFRAVTETRTINVLKADPIITWPNPAPIDVGTALSGTQLNAVANVDGMFEYSPVSGTVLPAGLGQTLTVTFTPDDASNFNSVEASVFLDVLGTFDYGDAPSAYPVLLANDGARHAVGGLVLGNAVDTDSDGQPSAAADGDGPDDDGVVAIADVVVVSGQQTTSSFVVSSSGSGQLDAWIDFNGDGDWQDTGEQIADNTSLQAGSNLLSFSFRGGDGGIDTAARFRLSTAGGLSPTGEATDGEVEDYIVSLSNGDASPSASVRLPGTVAMVRIDAASARVLDGQTTLFAVPAGVLDSLAVVGGAGDDQVTLEREGGGDAILSVDGAAGSNTLLITGPATDLTDTGLIEAQRFDKIDLSDTSENQITVDATSVAELSPTEKKVRVVGGIRDKINFADANDWRLTQPLLDNGVFVQVILQQLSGEVVEFVATAPWQNAIQSADVNNSGSVTAGDALRIVNELADRSFSDGDTQVLPNAETVTPWPGVYFDQNGDGKVTALDALGVINALAAQSIPGQGGSGEGESVQWNERHPIAWSPQPSSGASATWATPRNEGANMTGDMASETTPRRIANGGSAMWRSTAPTQSTSVQATSVQDASPGKEDPWGRAVNELLKDGFDFRRVDSA